jgi:ribosomal protein L24
MMEKLRGEDQLEIYSGEERGIQGTVMAYNIGGYPAPG